jgi:nucleoside-diphosphate-sugar epimerase
VTDFSIVETSRLWPRGVIAMSSGTEDGLMTSILVTGGAGYIGSHTCKALSRAGFDPITYDNLGRGNPESVKWGALEVGELADSVRLHDTIARHRPAALFTLRR